jgi:hypothetical protein
VLPSGLPTWWPTLTPPAAPRRKRGASRGRRRHTDLACLFSLPCFCCRLVRFFSSHSARSCSRRRRCWFIFLPRARQNVDHLYPAAPSHLLHSLSFLHAQQVSHSRDPDSLSRFLPIPLIPLCLSLSWLQLLAPFPSTEPLGHSSLVAFPTLALAWWSTPPPASLTTYVSDGLAS